MSIAYNFEMSKEKFLQEFGLNLKIERVRNKLTQEKLAELVDCSTPFIGYIERGIKSVTIYQFLKIAKVLNLDLNKFFKDIEL